MTQPHVDLEVLFCLGEMRAEPAFKLGLLSAFVIEMTLQVVLSSVDFTAPRALEPF